MPVIAILQLTIPKEEEEQVTGESNWTIHHHPNQGMNMIFEGSVMVVVALATIVMIEGAVAAVAAVDKAVVDITENRQGTPVHLEIETEGVVDEMIGRLPMTLEEIDIWTKESLQ